MSFLGYIRAMSSQISEKFMKLQRSSIDRLIVRSALNPILWPTAIIAPPAFYLSFLAQGNLRIGLFSIGLLLVVTTVFSYLYMLFKRPEDLRSEEYLLRREELRIIGSKDNLEMDKIGVEIEAAAGSISSIPLIGGDIEDG